MRKGRFITLEGGEGAGKSTQCRALVVALQAREIEAIETREPGGSEGAEAIRQLLLTGSAEKWGTRAEALLFAAARSDHVERLIKPSLARGAWVICDRFVDSSRAYQGEGSGIDDATLLALHQIGSGGLMPDRTFVLTLPSEMSAARARARDGDTSDRIAARDAAYHDRVAQAFAAIAAREPERVRSIDASGSPDDVTQTILADLADLMP